MKNRSFPHSGATTSRLGIGAMSFSNFYGEVSREEVFAILDAARDVGVSHIDTASVYGMGGSERHIGAYLAKNPQARSFFHIASKGGITDRKDPNRLFNNEAAYLTEQLDNSLERLGVECIDLYYIHRRDPSVPIEEVTETLAGFIKSGKIGGFGYSEISPTSLRAAHAVHPVAALQSEYSLSTRTPELGILQTCADLGTTFVAFSPVGRSLLTDAPHGREAVQSMPFLANNPRFMEPNLSMNIKAAAGFRALAAQMGLTAAGSGDCLVFGQRGPYLAHPGHAQPRPFQGPCGGRELWLERRGAGSGRSGAPHGLDQWGSLFRGTMGRA